VTSIEAYGRGYVAIHIQLLVNVLDVEVKEISCDYNVFWKFLNVMGSLLLPE
jgi:hypothetical protein